MTQTKDITDMLFSLEIECKKDKLKREYWQKATDEAYKIVGLKSPMALLRKTEEIYNHYMHEKRIYDEL